MSSSNEPLVKDFPPGPLDEYRKQASFDWKKLKLFFEDEDLLKFKVNFKFQSVKIENTILSVKYEPVYIFKLQLDVWGKMEADPVFQHPNVSFTTEQAREAAVKRMYRLRGWDVLPRDKLLEDLRRVLIFVLHFKTGLILAVIYFSHLL